jgi:hypothetical protein
LPIIWNCPPPSSAGVTKLPIDRTKTKTKPVAMPATVIGSVTRRKVVQPDAPRSREASVISGFRRDSGA